MIKKILFLFFLFSSCFLYCKAPGIQSPSNYFISNNSTMTRSSIQETNTDSSLQQAVMVGDADKVEVKICDANGHCVVKTITKDEQSALKNGNQNVRACSTDEDPNCTDWQDVNVDLQKGLDSAKGPAANAATWVKNEVIYISLGIGAGILIGFSASKIPVLYKYFVKNYRDAATSGKSIGDSVFTQNFSVSNSTKSKTILFSFDLDETITDIAYKGSIAQRSGVKLKPGVKETFLSIIKNGHYIVVNTYNVREVEDFLRDRLGFAGPANNQEWEKVRKYLLIKQPTIAREDSIFVKSNIDPTTNKLTKNYRGIEPLTEFASEVFKTTKGKMNEEALTELESRGIKVDFLVFSDDKRRFINQVLHETIGIPVIALEVGNRKDENYNPKKYTDHLDLVRSLAENSEYVDKICERLGRDGKALFKAEDIRNYMKTIKMPRPTNEGLVEYMKNISVQEARYPTEVPEITSRKQRVEEQTARETTSRNASIIGGVLGGAIGAAIPVIIEKNNDITGN